MLDMGSYTFRDTKEALISLGHDVDELYYHFADRFNDDFFSERIDLCIKRNHYDAILSINFFPLLAIAAHEHCIPYISWSYDSPLSEQLTEYFGFDTNRIYLFDRNEVEYYNSCGFKNVFHLPLAINPKRINSLSFSNETNAKYRSEISFVGAIHDSHLNELLYYADNYIKGYIEGIFQAQFRVYGCNFIENSISDGILESINYSLSNHGYSGAKLNKRGLSYAINARITQAERSLLLNLLSADHDVHLYSTRSENLDNRVKQCGPVKYYSDMNAVFRNSLLNLCPTLRSISSGIPLRALDILANRAVLFSNYQPELAEYFSDGKDVIMYDSIDDAVDKADFYLSHKEKLSEIASSGYEKAIKYFSYQNIIPLLLEYSFK